MNQSGGGDKQIELRYGASRIQQRRANFSKPSRHVHGDIEYGNVLQEFLKRAQPIRCRRGTMRSLALMSW